MENFNTYWFGAFLAMPFALIAGFMIRKFIFASLTKSETVVMIISLILVAIGAGFFSS